MKITRSNTWFKYLLVTIWVLFSLSLAGWWYIFVIEQIEKVTQIEHSGIEELRRKTSMIRWEGLTLLLSLVGGGFALGFYAFRELRQKQEIQRFFVTFTHELKTPLASLRLQAESLKEDLEGMLTTNPHLSPHLQLLKRLVADTTRLGVRLENSLFLGNLDDARFYLEPLQLSDLVSRVRGDFDDLQIVVQNDARILADARAFESILRNIIQNAKLHGQASEVVVSVCRCSERYVEITLVDNGRGVQGDTSRLGALFYRPYSGSGSGVGLYLCRALLKRMSGELKVNLDMAKGFSVTCKLQGQPL